MRILITGASGFVGQALVPRLMARGDEVFALGRVSLNKEGVTDLRGDLQSGATPTFPAGIDAVVHLAQSRAYRRFPIDAVEMFRINVAGTQMMLEAAARSGIRRFCLVSSGSVYDPFEGVLTEEAAVAPRGYLGASKLAAEVLARPFGGLFPVATLRLFAPYGPGQTGRLVPDLARRVGDGIPILLPETGEGMRFSPTHVDDACAVIEAAVDEGWTDVVNVAAPSAITIRQAAATLAGIMGRPLAIERKAMPAPAIVPDLTRLSSRYDLSRFRIFAEGAKTVCKAGGPSNEHVGI
jgi:nucleoside-diphosphate-sugar epimerase